jgi:ribosomal protein S18 acetylase RimI-like enzyme
LRALTGVCLASRVDADAGHITQLCVAPGERGRGIGREMLRRTLDVLAGHGIELASLTVTERNDGAVSLYRRLGFETWRRFYAFVWEGA